jgi:hypothetical protein
MSPESEKRQGSCLCGIVRFAIELPTIACAHCHCSMCRRAHGAAFVTWVLVGKEQLDVLSGANRLVRYASSKGATRSFCGVCGSSLFFEAEHFPGQVHVVRANIEGEIDRAPDMHVFFSDRVPWVRLADDLPRFGGTTGMEPVE